MVKYSPGSLDATFAALADPSRRAILARLARGESSVTELAEPFDISLPAVSKHLRVLEQAGLLARQKDGRVHRCGLVAGPLREAASFLARYRRFWEAQFDGLARYLDESKTKEERPWHTKAPARKPRFTSGGRSRPRGTRSSAPGRTRKS